MFGSTKVFIIPATVCMSDALIITCLAAPQALSYGAHYWDTSPQGLRVWVVVHRSILLIGAGVSRFAGVDDGTRSARIRG